MVTTTNEVLEFIQENDVKFVRLAFCDLSGIQKNISIMPDELPYAFTYGISFDAHAIQGFADITKSDLFLFPDPKTLSILTWRPQSGRVIRFFCDIRHGNGEPFWGDLRYRLKQTMKKAMDMGYMCRIGAECEFYLFHTQEDGTPSRIPFDQGSYLDIAPLDKGENVRREICLTLEEMGIHPESSHHEQGPGQNEIDVRFSDPLSSADHLMTFKNVVKTVAARNGLYASFAPKPLSDAPGNGMHINLSLTKYNLNIFQNQSEYGEVVDHFIAGILAHTKEMSVFLNPIPNSYERLGVNEAPAYVSWSHGNRSQLIRIPEAVGERVRMELRSPDPTINPYLAFTLVLEAGMDGIAKQLPLTPPLDVDLYQTDETITSSLERLPATLEEAIQVANDSAWISQILPSELLDNFLGMKTKECEELSDSADADSYFMKHHFHRF